MGTRPERIGPLVALGYGGNGIMYSIVASQVLRDLCLGRPNEDATLFRLDRSARP